MKSKTKARLRGLSINKSWLIKLHDQILDTSDSKGLFLHIPGHLSFTVKNPRVSPHNDNGEQLKTKFYKKSLFLLHRHDSLLPLHLLQHRLDLLLFLTKKVSSLKEARHLIKKHHLLNDFLSPYSTLSFHNPHRLLAHSIKNFLPLNPSLLNVSSSTSILLPPKEGFLLPSSLSIDRLNRL